MNKEKFSNTIPYIIFVYLGMLCLTSWNVILVSLDMYQFYFEDFDPTYYFPLMNIILNVVFQFYLVFNGNKFTYQKQMLFSLIILTITIALLPLVTINLKGQLGFIIVCLLIAFNGFANAIFQCNIFGIGGFLPFTFIVALSYGNGIAGIMINLLKYIIIFSYGVNNSSDEDVMQISAIIFYGLNVILLIIGMVSLLYVFRNPWFIYNVNKGGLKDEFDQEVINSIKENYEVEMNDILDEKSDNEELKTDEDKMSNLEVFKVLFKKIYNVNFLIFMNFFLSISMYPSMILELPLL